MKTHGNVNPLARHVTKSYVYRNARPSIVIESRGGKQLGNCYHASYYRVTSLRKLTKETIDGMFRLGLIGYGQEFCILTKCDGSEEPAGTDTVPCVVIDEGTGEVIDEPAINPYSGEPYGPNMQPYYVYDTESRCDSGD